MSYVYVLKNATSDRGTHIQVIEYDSRYSNGVNPYNPVILFEGSFTAVISVSTDNPRILVDIQINPQAQYYALDGPSSDKKPCTVTYVWNGNTLVLSSRCVSAYNPAPGAPGPGMGMPSQEGNPIPLSGFLSTNPITSSGMSWVWWLIIIIVIVIILLIVFWVVFSRGKRYQPPPYQY
jgi:hypothetical protein